MPSLTAGILRYSGIRTLQLDVEFPRRATPLYRFLFLPLSPIRTNRSTLLTDCAWRLTERVETRGEPWLFDLWAPIRQVSTYPVTQLH